MRTMSEEEREEMIVALDAMKARANHDKQFARQMLIDLGILTKKGKIRKGREALCMLLSRGSL